MNQNHVYFIDVQRLPEDLCGHDEAGGLGTDLDVARQESDVPKGVLKVSELLIGQGFDRRGVDGPVTTLKADMVKILTSKMKKKAVFLFPHTQ